MWQGDEKWVGGGGVGMAIIGQHAPIGLNKWAQSGNFHVLSCTILTRPAGAA